MNENTNNKPENPSIYPDPARGSQQSYSNQDSMALESGITLRDHFAGLAMQGLIPDLLKKEREFLNKGILIQDVISRDAYRIADVMLTHREKTK